jgi:hypothetical protein
MRADMLELLNDGAAVGMTRIGQPPQPWQDSVLVMEQSGTRQPARLVHRQRLDNDHCGAAPRPSQIIGVELVAWDVAVCAVRGALLFRHVRDVSAEHQAILQPEMPNEYRRRQIWMLDDDTRHSVYSLPEMRPRHESFERLSVAILLQYSPLS